MRIDEAPFEGWLNVLTRNLLTDRYRATHGERQFVSIEDNKHAFRHAARSSERPDSIYARKEKQALLRRAFAKLPRELRESVLLHHVFDLRQWEIAEKTGVPEGTVKSRLNRGRSIMAEMLKRHKFAA